MSDTTKLVTFSLSPRMIELGTQAVTASIDHEANKYNQIKYRVHLTDSESVVVSVGDTCMVWGTRTHASNEELKKAFDRLRLFVSANGNRVALKVEKVVQA
jgi:hypothetical protein